MLEARLAVGVLVLVPAVAVAQPFSVAPSYSCGGELSPIEQTICTTPFLANLDVHLSRQYRYAHKRLGASVRDDQRAWLNARNAACGDLGVDARIGCLADQYNTRLEALSAAVDDPAPAAADWNGAWSNAFADLTIAPSDNGATISGSAVYITPNVCGAGPNLGTFDADLAATALTGAQLAADGGEGCALKLRLRGALIEVEQVEPFACAGHRVSFGGIYSQGGVQTTLDCG